MHPLPGLRSRAALFPLTLFGSLVAQTPLAGNLAGTLAAGVYHATSTLVVPTGQTLTLAPGVIIKFTGGQEFTVNGTLLANGTAGSPVILTDLQDDSAGGDTNGNGPSTGSPTAWRGVVFNPGASASTLHWLDARFGGHGYVSNFHLGGTSPTFVHCTSRGCYVSGMNLNGAATPSVVECSFVGNGGFAIDNVPIAALPGFANNSATGNTSGDFARVTAGVVSGSLTLAPANMVHGAIVLDSGLAVPAGSTLTLAAGVVLKWR
ncbi:MAG: hypothetical protein IT455_20925, partial [Planctomycetes bacterium]|nr:hypothetical protein [Planctomycetota bacterium]